jgi:hypothetical protein
MSSRPFKAARGRATASRAANDPFSSPARIRQESRWLESNLATTVNHKVDMLSVLCRSVPRCSQVSASPSRVATCGTTGKSGMLAGDQRWPLQSNFLHGGAIVFEVYLSDKRDLLVVQTGTRIPLVEASGRWRRKKKAVRVSDEIRSVVRKQGYYVRKLNNRLSQSLQHHR